MFWKMRDLSRIDLSNSKITISSVSKWSKPNDVKRLLMENSYCENYAFHTGCEERPWLLLELEKELSIDFIRITNRNDSQRDRLKAITVFLSSDGAHWTKIDQNMYIWSADLAVLNIELYSSVSFKYIRFMLDDTKKTYLHFLKLELFSFKQQGFIMSSRTDGFGMRMVNILIGMYLAKRLNFSFGFTWRNENKDVIGIHLDTVENIFSQEFIEKFFYKSDNNLIKEHVVEKAFYNIKDINICKLKHAFSEKFGYYSPGINFGLPYEYINGISKDEFLCEVRNIFKQINFSNKLNNIFKFVNNYTNNIGDFVAIHIRNGEVVYDSICKTYLLQLWLGDRYFPYEIALEICFIEIKKGKKVIIFGQDSECNNNLYKLLNKQYPSNIILADKLLDAKYSNFEKSFFEVTLMSKASTVFTSGKIKANSAFSILASFIAGKYNLVSYNEIFSDKEQYEIIKKNYIFFERNHKLQLSMVNFKMFQLSLKLFLNFNEKMFYLNKALDNDPDNDGYRIYILDLLFKQKQYEAIEKMIKNEIIFREKIFIDTIFINKLSEKKVYEWHMLSYLNFPFKQTYPYISHIAALIAYRLKDTDSALLWNQYSLKKVANEIKFIQLSHKVQAEKTIEKEL